MCAVVPSAFAPVFPGPATRLAGQPCTELRFRGASRTRDLRFPGALTCSPAGIRRVVLLLLVLATRGVKPSFRKLLYHLSYCPNWQVGIEPTTRCSSTGIRQVIQSFGPGDKGRRHGVYCSTRLSYPPGRGGIRTRDQKINVVPPAFAGVLVPPALRPRGVFTVGPPGSRRPNGRGPCDLARKRQSGRRPRPRSCRCSARLPVLRPATSRKAGCRCRPASPPGSEP